MQSWRRLEPSLWTYIKDQYWYSQWVDNESEEEEQVLYDIIWNPFNAKGKGKRKRRDTEDQKIKRKRERQEKKTWRNLWVDPKR